MKHNTGWWEKWKRRRRNELLDQTGPATIYHNQTGAYSRDWVDRNVKRQAGRTNQSPT